MSGPKPIAKRSRRVQPLAALPVFFDLKGANVIVAGDGEGATWKAELLAAVGASVSVYAPDPSRDIIALEASPPAGCVTVRGRKWQSTDLAGSSLAVGELEGRDARLFVAAARAHGVPVNIVDTPDLSDFSFGTIVNRAPVTVAIGTDGVAPVLGQAIRARIEALLHPSLGDWAGAARNLRETIKSRLPMGAERRALWRRFADRALSAQEKPGPNDLEGLFASHVAKGGAVTLVGAGPGDPEHLTLKAIRFLQTADVVLFDRSVSPEVLELARREARRMLVSTTSNGPGFRDNDISTLMVRLAHQGKHVVRLTGGNQTCIAMAIEEVATCRHNDIHIEIVPGTTTGDDDSTLTVLHGESGNAEVQFDRFESKKLNGSKALGNRGLSSETCVAPVFPRDWQTQNEEHAIDSAATGGGAPTTIGAAIRARCSASKAGPALHARSENRMRRRRQ